MIAICATTMQVTMRIIIDVQTSQTLATPIITRSGIQKGEEIGKSEAAILRSPVGFMRVK